MTTTERNEYVKSTVAEMLEIGSIGTQIDRYTWAIPVEVDGTTIYAKVNITAALSKATKANPAFNLENAVAAFEADEAERKAKAEEKAKKEEEKMMRNKK